nr:PREDICTED: putative methyltransferase DDB_G0268948 [Bemisia tabaci]
MALNYVRTAAQAQTAVQAQSQCRHLPPENMIKKIIGYLGERLTTPYETAVDVGCGSGQSSEAIAPYFKNVVAFDTNENQLENAQRRTNYFNIIYRKGSAERIDCLDSSVTLVTAGQSSHWFDLPKFLAEVERVLVPGGVLSIYGHYLPKLSHPTYSIEYLIEKFLVCGKLTEYMPEESKKIYMDRYTHGYEKFPFSEEPVIRDESYSVELPTTVADVVSYISTFSSITAYREKHGDRATAALLQNFENELLDSVRSNKKPEETNLSILFRYILLMGRKPFY